MSEPVNVNRYSDTIIKDQYGATIPGIQQFVEGASVPQLSSVLVERGASVPKIQALPQVIQQPRPQSVNIPCPDTKGGKS